MALRATVEAFPDNQSRTRARRREAFKERRNIAVRRDPAASNAARIRWTGRGDAEARNRLAWLTVYQAKHSIVLELGLDSAYSCAT